MANSELMNNLSASSDTLLLPSTCRKNGPWPILFPIAKCLYQKGNLYLISLLEQCPLASSEAEMFIENNRLRVLVVNALVDAIFQYTDYPSS